MKHKKIFIYTDLIFIYGLFIFYVYLDFSGGNALISDACKFISVLLCFLLSLLIGGNSLNSKDKLLLQAGLGVTVTADLFLLLLDREAPGVLLFCIVQIIYCIRYELRRFGIVMLAVFLIYVPIFGLHNIMLNAVFYSVCLLTSVFAGFRVFKYKLFPAINGRMVFAGMVLFLLCDICVGLYNLPYYMPVSDFLLNATSISVKLIWIFYLNSQVLLALSGYRKRSII